MPKKPINKMPVSDRAKQFMPFSALKGLDEALRTKEKIVVPKVELSPEMAEELDYKMHLLEKGKVTTIIYQTSRVIQIVNTKIRFDDIFDIRFDV